MSEETIQCVFDFNSGNPDGYENWQREQEENNARIRKTWRLPIGRRVLLRIRNLRQDFTGKLELAEQPTELNRKAPFTPESWKDGFL